MLFTYIIILVLKHKIIPADESFCEIPYKNLGLFLWQKMLHVNCELDGKLCNYSESPFILI